MQTFSRFCLCSLPVPRHLLLLLLLLLLHFCRDEEPLVRQDTSISDQHSVPQAPLRVEIFCFGFGNSGECGQAILELFEDR